MTLRFENIKKYYGAFLALDIPALEVAKGVWWVKGENGSGKTTLLKMIAGLHPFEGNILLNELNIKKQRQQYVGLVNYAEAEPLYPDFITAKDLVELYCKTKNGNLQQALLLLQELHIDEAYKKPVAAYSSGIVKKLSLVLAFIGNPKLILLDEPLITIDALALAVICKKINEEVQSGISFLITSHQELPENQVPLTGIILAENQTITSQL